MPTQEKQAYQTWREAEIEEGVAIGIEKGIEKGKVLIYEKAVKAFLKVNPNYTNAEIARLMETTEEIIQAVRMNIAK